MSLIYKIINKEKKYGNKINKGRIKKIKWK